MIEKAVLLASILLQLAAALLAVRLVRFTGLKSSWILISAAFILMALRRAIPLWHLMAGHAYLVDLGNEVLGLALSLLLLVGMAGVGPIFRERREALDRVAGLLAEKELVLHEVHHRIKNNMATVSALLHLQADASKEPAVSKALAEAASRVNGMLLLYDRLYRQDSFDSLSARDYLGSLVDAVLLNLGTGIRIEVEKSLEDTPLDAHRLYSLGIVVNELLSNSLKHAFAGRSEGRIALGLSRDGEGLRFSYRDDGPGLPPREDWRDRAGFGMTLVRGLVEQLGGSLELDGGAGFRASFSIQPA